MFFMNDRESKALVQAVTASTAAVTSLHAWLQASAGGFSKRDAKEMEERLLKETKAAEKRILAALDPVLSAAGAAALAKVKASTAKLDGATDRVEAATERVEGAG